MEIVQAAEPTETPAEAPVAAPAAAPDFDALVGRFEAAIAPKLDALEARLPPAAAAPVTDPRDPNFFDPDSDYDPTTGQVTDEAQDRAFWAEVDQKAATIAEAKIAEALAPITADRRAEQIAAEADALELKYPALSDDATQEKVIGAAVRYAQALGLPPEQAETVALSPRFIELTYQAMLAQDQQASATAPGGPSVPLEQGGAAGPAASTDDAPDAGDRIVQLAQSSRFRLGS